MPSEVLALTWKEALQQAKVGDTKLREAVNDGELVVMRVGDRVLIEPEELLRWLRSKRHRAGHPIVEEPKPHASNPESEPLETPALTTIGIKRKSPRGAPMAYPGATPPPFDPARAAQSEAEIAQAVSLTADDPAVRFLAGRGIPAAIALGCHDLRLLTPPITGRPHTDFACVSLLRPAPGADPTGAELAFVDILGRPAATEPRRVQWRFVENGCRDAWFWAGGSGEFAVVSESFAPTRWRYAPQVCLGKFSAGAQGWLRFKKLPPGIKQLTIVADRRPSESEIGGDGKPLREGHDADYRRSASRAPRCAGALNVRDAANLECFTVLWLGEGQRSALAQAAGAEA